MSSKGTTSTGNGAAANTGAESKSPSTDRRGSHSSGYAGLMAQKRNSLDDKAWARRKSFDEQKPATGIIGNMWNNFTQGSRK